MPTFQERIALTRRTRENEEAQCLARQNSRKTQEEARLKRQADTIIKLLKIGRAVAEAAKLSVPIDTIRVEYSTWKGHTGWKGHAGFFSTVPPKQKLVSTERFSGWFIANHISVTHDTSTDLTHPDFRRGLFLASDGQIATYNIKQSTSTKMPDGTTALWLKDNDRTDITHVLDWLTTTEVCNPALPDCIEQNLASFVVSHELKLPDL
jgi:hypothetical protein